MDTPQIKDGAFEARYLAFLETIKHLRPKLHGYCSRMTGSILDGEDVVQDALFQAYRNIDTFDDSRPLAPWLFRIAYNQCIDFLRRRKVRNEAEAGAVQPDSVESRLPAALDLGYAVERLVLSLPPKERACILLKDVFDYTLEEIAELVDSTVGGVKAALKRGRSKLAALPRTTPQPRNKSKDRETARLLHLYVDRFNRRDWDGVRELTTADARLQVLDRLFAPLNEAPYFYRYEQRTVPWRLSVGEFDGEPVAIVLLRRGTDEWTPQSVVRLEVAEGQITRITDYGHIPWILPAATSLVLDQASSN